MDFFSRRRRVLGSDAPQDEEERSFRPPDWFGAPENVLPGVAAVQAFLVRRDDLVIALRGVEVYPTGCLLALAVAARRAGRPREEWDRLSEGAFEHYRGVSGEEQGLRLGVEFADGRAATSLDRFDHGRLLDPEAEPPEPPVLQVGHGGGSSGGSELHLQRTVWLWPLPPAEPFDLVLEWPAFSVPVIRRPIDGRVLRAAADAAQPFWP